MDIRDLLESGPGPLPASIQELRWEWQGAEWVLVWTATYGRACGPVTITESLTEAEL